MFSLSHCCQSFPSLGVTVHLASLACPPALCWSLRLLWGQLRLSAGAAPVCSRPQRPQPAEPGVFSCGSARWPCYTPHRGCLLDRVASICSLHSSWEGFGSSLVTPPLGLLWFYFHLWMWIVHWGLLLRLPWRTWVCPCEGQVWRWCSCLGRRGSGSTRYSGELVAKPAGNAAL